MFRFSYLLILIILSCVIISSCTHPEEPQDTTPPQLVVVSPIENQRVKGDITIEALVEENGTGFTMQIFLDGNLLKQTSGAQISAVVDTKTLTEGTHTIKITATDAAGNVSEKVFTIQVRNILFKMHVSSNYVPDDTRIYYSLSKNDGTLIALNEIENNGLLSVPTPSDFNPDSSFVVTEYFYLSIPGFIARAINISAGLNAGEYFLPDYPSNLPVAGTHHIKITEVPIEYNSAILDGTNIGWYLFGGGYGSGGAIEVDASLSNNTSDLFFSLTPGDGTGAPVYNYISTIQVGGSTEFSVTGLPQMPKVDVTTADLVGSYSCYVFNNSLNSPITFFYREGNFEDGKIPVYYPSTSNPQYVFDLQYQNGSNFYHNRLRTAVPTPSFQYLNASVSNVNYANQKLKVTSTGAYDVGMIVGGNSSIGDNGGTFLIENYSVSFPNGTTSKIAIPTTSAELMSLGFISASDISFTGAYLTDYVTLSGSSDYQNQIVFSADRVLRQYKDQISKGVQITPTSNGRMSAQKKITLPKHLETILKNHSFRLN